MEIIYLLIGMVVGTLAAWLVLRFKFSAETQRGSAALLVEIEKNKALQLQLTELKKEIESERAKVLEANQSLAAAEADYRNLQEKLTDQKKELEAMSEKFTLQFKNLA